MQGLLTGDGLAQKSKGKSSSVILTLQTCVWLIGTTQHFQKLQSKAWVLYLSPNRCKPLHIKSLQKFPLGLKVTLVTQDREQQLFLLATPGDGGAEADKPFLAQKGAGPQPAWSPLAQRCFADPRDPRDPGDSPSPVGNGWRLQAARLRQP